MTEIPIKFDHQGKHYKGFFSEVTGAGKLIGRDWHLMLYKKGGVYYYGHLMYHEQTGFRFASQTGEFEDLTEFFGQYVMLWYE